MSGSRCIGYIPSGIETRKEGYKKCREMQETWTRQQTATSAGVAVVIAAAVTPPKRPQATARGEGKASIGTTAAAQENIPRGSAGKQSKALSGATDAAQAKSPRGSHGEQVNEPNGAAAAILAGRREVKLRRLETRQL